MKTAGIMQPYLFPYLGYYQLLNAVDEYAIYDDVQYIKGGWINRNNMLIGGQKVLFTMSLQDASPNKKINEIEVADDFVKFQKTIDMAYHKAPHFETVRNLIARICSYEDRNLAAFLGNSLVEVSTYLGIDTNIRYTSNLDKGDGDAQSKVIAMCKAIGVDRYLNAIGGQELYDKSSFEKRGIELSFLKAHLRPYKQFKNDFIPGLSILDVMMFNSVEEVSGLLKDYELV